MTAARRARGLPWGRFAIVAVLLVLDLWTKAAVFAWLEEGPRPDGMAFLAATGHWRYPLPPGAPADSWLAFMTSRNPGAAFGQLQDWPWLLVVGRCVAAVVLTVLLWRPQPRVVRAALVLVLAGALGNLYDNLFLGSTAGRTFGEVRDFIDVYFPFRRAHFPTFNVADSCITVGAVLLLASSFRRLPEEEDEGQGGEERERVDRGSAGVGGA